MRKLTLSLKIIIILIIIHLSCFSSVFSQDPFIITNNTLKIIPTKHLSFLEGYDETVTFDKLENSKWTKKLTNPQSMVNGYWVRFTILNNFEDNKLGVYHNYNREKKIYQKNSLGLIEHDYWNLSFDNHIAADRIGTNYRIDAPKGENTTIYNFFRNIIIIFDDFF